MQVEVVTGEGVALPFGASDLMRFVVSEFSGFS